jgi:hypothetical protein
MTQPSKANLITGIDHAVVVTNDLDAARETWNRLGFTTTPKGLHSVGSSNHCMMLGRDYLELLHMPANLTGEMSPMRKTYVDFLKIGDGLAGVALASENAEGARTALEQNGFEPDTLRDLGRDVNDHGRQGRAKFKLLHIHPRTTPGALVFICQHFTRDLVWMPEYQRHANGALEIAAVSFIGDQAGGVSKAATTYGRLFGGAGSAQRIDEGMLVQTGSAPISFSSRQALQARLIGVDLPTRAGMVCGALWIRVRSREATAAWLKKNDVPFKKMLDGSLAVGASFANGVAVVFG